MSTKELIQIDDILIRQGKCPTNNCNFESNHCFWQNMDQLSDNVIKTLKPQITWEKHSVDDNFIKQLPKVDANGSKLGHYLLLYTINQFDNNTIYKGTLVSQIMQPKAQHALLCLSFWTFVSNQTSLSIYQSINNQIKLLLTLNDQAGKWRQHKININVPEEVSSFIYIVGSLASNLSFIALDNIFTSDKKCPNQMASNFSSYPLSKHANCDFITDLCKWTLQGSKLNHFHWELDSFNSSSDKFISAQSSSHLINQLAEIISPILYNSKPECKVNFLFSIKDDIILNVLVIINENEPLEIWSSEALSYQLNDLWSNATAYIGRINTTYKIVFQAQKLNRISRSVVRVDDITFEDCDYLQDDDHDQTNELNCDFEQSLCYLEQIINWTVSTKQEHLINGPTRDHSNGQNFLLLKGHDVHDIRGSIQGPIVEPATCISFYYFMSPKTSAVVIITESIAQELTSDTTFNWKRLFINKWINQNSAPFWINVTLTNKSNQSEKFFAIDDLSLIKNCLPDHNSKNTAFEVINLMYTSKCRCKMITL